MAARTADNRALMGRGTDTMSSQPQHRHPAAGGVALRRALRSVTNIDGLLAALSLLYFLTARDRIAQPGLYLGALAVYGTAVLALRFTPILAECPRERLLAATAAMVVFITSALGFCGGEPGPLLNLYLLPIVASAFTLGRGPTALMVGLAFGGRLALSVLAGEQAMLTLGYALALLTEAVPVLLVAFLSSALAADVEDASERLQTMAERDDLTGLLNLQAFTRLVAEERGRAIRRGSGFALLRVNIDGLKAVNDRFGHEAGDRALVGVAQALRRSSRSVDLVARYGGDEFVMFLAGAGGAVAKLVVNRIRHNVATTTLDFGGALQRVTVAVGAGVFPADGRDLRDLLNAAGRALEKDKDSRRPLERSEAALRASPARSVEA